MRSCVRSKTRKALGEKGTQGQEGGQKVTLLKTGFILENRNLYRRKKMKRLMTVLTVLFVFSISAFAQMNTGQGGQMMDGGWGIGYGMNSGWIFLIILAILAVVVIAYMKKRK